MTSGAQNVRPDALALHPDDDVAVLLRDVAAGECIHVLVGGILSPLDIRTAVPSGHKAALRDMPAGHHVRKYSEVIGELVAPVEKGAHVHVHNLFSLRAR
jgi:hypothetical protein